MPIKSLSTDPTIDTLPHINGNIAPSTSRPDTLKGKVASLSGCIGFLTYMEVCYNVQDNEVDIAVKLLGISLGECHLIPTSPQCTLGGGAFGLKAQAAFTYDFTTQVLQISGEACAPFQGCSSGNTSIQL